MGVDTSTTSWYHGDIFPTLNSKYISLCENVTCLWTSIKTCIVLSVVSHTWSKVARKTWDQSRVSRMLAFASCRHACKLWIMTFAPWRRVVSLQQQSLMILLLSHQTIGSGDTGGVMMDYLVSPIVECINNSLHGKPVVRIGVMWCWTRGASE